MAASAEIAWNGRRAIVGFAEGTLRNASGRVVLRPAGGGEWRVLDRSPVSVRLARPDGAVCRFEAAQDGVRAEMVGGSWEGREASGGGLVVMLDTEVRDGNVAAQDRAG